MAILEVRLTHQHGLHRGRWISVTHAVRHQISGVGQVERVVAAQANVQLGAAVVAVVEAQVGRFAQDGVFGPQPHLFQSELNQAAHAEGNAVFFSHGGGHYQVSAQGQQAALEQAGGKHLRRKSALAVGRAQAVQFAVFNAAAPGRARPARLVRGRDGVHVAGQQQIGAVLHPVQHTHHVAKVVGGDGVEIERVKLLLHQCRGTRLVPAQAARAQEGLREGHQFGLQTFQLALQ